MQRSQGPEAVKSPGTPVLGSAAPRRESPHRQAARCPSSYALCRVLCYQCPIHGVPTLRGPSAIRPAEQRPLAQGMCIAWSPTPASPAAAPRGPASHSAALGGPVPCHARPTGAPSIPAGSHQLRARSQALPEGPSPELPASSPRPLSPQPWSWDRAGAHVRPGTSPPRSISPFHTKETPARGGMDGHLP